VSRPLLSAEIVQANRKKLVTAGVFLVALAAAYFAAQFVLNDDWKSLAFVALAFVGVAFSLKILGNWRQGLYIFFGWLFFEDFARKYLGNNPVMFFAKDFLVVLVYISFYLARRKRTEPATFRPPFLMPLLVLVWFAVAQVFNPASTSVFYGFLGLKLYFMYIPLMYLGYALIDSEQQLRRFFMFNAALLAVVGGLGIAQAIIGPTFLNPATLQEDIRELSTLYRISPITGQMAYRPTSVFVSTGRFQDLIVTSWIIVVGFGAYLLLRSKKGRGIAFTAIGVLAGAAVMSTSRGVVMWCGGCTLIIMAAFVWGAPRKQREVSRVLRSAQRVALLGGLAILTLAVIFPEQVGSRFAIYSETLSPYSTASELVSRTRDYPLKNFMDAFSTPRWMYGYGTGTASLGIQYITRIMNAPRTGVAVENGYGQLVIEMGVFGLLLWLILGTAISLSAWRIVKGLRGSPWFPLAFAIFWLVFMIFFPIGYNSMAFYQDFLVNCCVWLFLGILFKLPHLALASQFADKRATQPESVPAGLVYPPVPVGGLPSSEGGAPS